MQGNTPAAADDPLAKISAVITLYEEMASKLREGCKRPQVDGITGYHEFPKLAEAYESRARAYREAAEQLRRPMEALPPHMAEKERLALQSAFGGLAQVKGGAKLVSSKAVEGVKGCL
eukprot:TRINITY_DN4846_c0_g1_i1.p1 TRINITY_DN4846_c0_g1~~TRINITY_DN4846_c0_g1_i1.p1  ORF type:complete len:118 (+),score=29.59 TRINITY_DN4846_c0_g1_i1:67-420(+)